MTLRARLIHVYSTERGNEIIRRVRIWSQTNRNLNGNGGYVIRVGVSNQQGQIDWFGEWNQFETKLLAATVTELTGIDELNRPLARGEGCVIEVAPYGLPEQDSTGISIEWKFGRVGGVTDAAAKRLDSDRYIAPRSVNKPLFSLGKYVENRNTREAVEPLEQTLNSSGVTEWVLTVPITEPGTLIDGAGREPMPTGLFTGGEVNIVGGTDVQVLAGVGVITENLEYSLPISQTRLNWPDLQEAIAFPTTSEIVWIMLRESPSPGLAEIVQLNTRPTPEQQRSMIYIGLVTWDGAAWNDVSTPIVAGNVAQQFYEFMKDVVPPLIFLSGGSIAQQASFAFSIGAGEIWELNRNFNNDEDNPNRELFDAINPVVFRYTTSGFETVGAQTSTVIAANWENPLGTIAAIGGSAISATIQRVWLDQGNNFWVTRGQVIYSTFNEARASIAADTGVSFFDPFFTRDCLLLGYIIAARAQTNWSATAAFIPFVTGQGGGSGGSPIATFIGLTDTPASYAGGASKSVRVNAGGTGLEFVTPGGGGGGYAYVSGDAWTTFATTIFDAGLDTYKSSSLVSGLFTGLDAAKTYEARVSFQMVMFPAAASQMIASLRCIYSVFAGTAIGGATQQALVKCQAGQFSNTAGSAVFRFTGATQVSFVIQGQTVTGSGANAATDAGSIMVRLYESL